MEKWDPRDHCLQTGWPGDLQLSLHVLSQVVPADNAWGVRDCVPSKGFLSAVASCTGGTAPLLAPRPSLIIPHRHVLTSRETQSHAWDMDKELTR